jgi:cytochrome c oxidase cbb3-type subunit 1
MSQAVVDNAQDISGAPSVPDLSAADRSLIDASTRPVVLTFLLTALAWLVVSTGLGAILALQLIFPGFLDFSFSNFGRLEPVTRMAFNYGWCASAAMGVSAWLVARLSCRRLLGGSLAVFGSALWNLGLGIGIISSLAGKMRPLSGLEIPQSAAVIMYVGFGMYLLTLLATFRVTVGKVPLALMFVVGGACWMGWSFLLGNLLANSGNLVGVMTQVSADWTSSSVQWLWLVSVGLGSAYYVIPKVSGSPIFSGMLGRGCFWLYFVVAGLTASARLSGGPIPLWLSSVGASASILLLVPVLGSVFNLLASAGSAEKVINSPAGRFTCFGLILLSVGSILNAVAALRSIHFAVQFTLFGAGVSHFALNGFVTMSLFGAIYFIMPRLSACEWLSSTLVSWHFLGSAYGTGMGALSLILSGVASGSGLDSPDSNFRQILDLGASYYWARVISCLLLVFGLFAFALNFLLIALRVGQPAGEPTLFRNSEEH